MKNKGVGFRRISECYKYIDIIVMNGNNSSVARIVFAKTSSFVSLRDCLVLRGETKRRFEGLMIGLPCLTVLWCKSQVSVYFCSGCGLDG